MANAKKEYMLANDSAAAFASECLRISKIPNATEIKQKVYPTITHYVFNIRICRFSVDYADFLPYNSLYQAIRGEYIERQL